MAKSPMISTSVAIIVQKTEPASGTTAMTAKKTEAGPMRMGFISLPLGAESRAQFRAEQAPRPPDQNRDDDEEDDRQRPVRPDEEREGVDDAHYQRSDESTEDASEATDDDDSEGLDNQIDVDAESHGRRGNERARRQCGQRQAQGEHAAVDQTDADPESAHHLPAVDRRADDSAVSRELQQGPQAQRHAQTQADHDELIRVYERAENLERFDVERDAPVFDAPDQADEVPDDEDEGEGEEQLLGQLSLIHP